MKEESFIKRLAKGDMKIFQLLFEKYYYPLCGYANKFICDPDICSDLVNESFLQFWEKRKELNNYSVIKSYLYSSVRNACLNNIRHSKLIQKHNLEIYRENEISEFRDVLIETEVYAEIYSAIRNLVPREREIILKFMNGLSNKEISEDLNISLNTVKTLKKRAYKKLREKLSGIQWILFLFILLNINNFRFYYLF